LLAAIFGQIWAVIALEKGQSIFLAGALLTVAGGLLGSLWFACPRRQIRRLCESRLHRGAAIICVLSTVVILITGCLVRGVIKRVAVICGIVVQAISYWVFWSTLYKETWEFWELCGMWCAFRLCGIKPKDGVGGQGDEQQPSINDDGGGQGDEK
jgi:hypothetical protein